MILTKKERCCLLSGTGQARAAPLKSLLYISSLARLNLWNSPVGRGWCPRGADNFGNGCDAVVGRTVKRIGNRIRSE